MCAPAHVHTHIQHTCSCVPDGSAVLQWIIQSLWLNHCTKPVASSTFSILPPPPYCCINSHPCLYFSSPLHVYSPLSTFSIRLHILPSLVSIIVSFVVYSISLCLWLCLSFQWCVIIFFYYSSTFIFLWRVRWEDIYHSHVCPLNIELKPTAT